MNIDLTHPEILTIEQLQKFVGSDGINDRYELIHLFYKYVAPLPQRKFRSNRLGMMLTNTQRQLRGENPISSANFKMAEKKADGLTAQSQGEKHESDRGIYTITMQQSTTKNTAPIKLKRPSSTPITDGNQDDTKRLKSDTTNTGAD